MVYQEESSASGHDESWIQWFCGIKGHEIFCEVDRSYIEDGFNLYGLRACVSNFSDCLDLILDKTGVDESDDSHLTQSACTLYGFIHARYIITAHGLDAMYNKYAAKEFDICPLLQCNGQPVLPVGTTDEMGVDTVKFFCAKCQCIYHPPPLGSRSTYHGPGKIVRSGAIDGAAFGTTFPHLLLMTFSNLVPDGLSPDSAYVPRIFGFRMHQSARQRIRGGTHLLDTVYTSSAKNCKMGGLDMTASKPQSVMLGTQEKVIYQSLSRTTNDVVDAVRNNNAGSRPQDGNAEKDKTTSTPASFTYQSSICQEGSDNNVNQMQSIKKVSGLSFKSNKKGESDTKGNYKEGSSEDREILLKRKVKGSMWKYGNGEDNHNGLSAKTKIQKRPSDGVS